MVTPSLLVIACLLFDFAVLTQLLTPGCFWLRLPWDLKVTQASSRLGGVWSFAHTIEYILELLNATCYSEFSVETTEADRQFNSKASCNCRLSWRERSCIVRSNGRYFRVGGIYEQNLWRGTAGGNLWASGDIVGRWGGVLYEQHVGEDWRGSRTAAPALALCALASRRRSGRTNLVSALPPNLPLHCVSFSSLALCFLGSKRCCWRFECRDTFVGLSIQWLPQPFCDSLHVSSALPLKYQDCPHFILSLQHY